MVPLEGGLLQGNGNGVGIVLALVLLQHKLHVRWIRKGIPAVEPLDAAVEIHRFRIQGVFEGNVAVAGGVEIVPTVRRHQRGALGGKAVSGRQDLNRTIGVRINLGQAREGLLPGAGVAVLGVLLAKVQHQQIVVEPLAVVSERAAYAVPVRGHPLPVAICDLALQKDPHRAAHAPHVVAVFPIHGNGEGARTFQLVVQRRRERRVLGARFCGNRASANVVLIEGRALLDLRGVLTQGIHPRFAVMGPLRQIRYREGSVGVGAGRAAGPREIVGRAGIGVLQFNGRGTGSILVRTRELQYAEDVLAGTPSVVGVVPRNGAGDSHTARGVRILENRLVIVRIVAHVHNRQIVDEVGLLELCAVPHLIGGRLIPVNSILHELVPVGRAVGRIRGQVRKVELIDIQTGNAPA